MRGLIVWSCLFEFVAADERLEVQSGFADFAFDPVIILTERTIHWFVLTALKDEPSAFLPICDDEALLRRPLAFASTNENLVQN